MSYKSLSNHDARRIASNAYRFNMTTGLKQLETNSAQVGLIFISRADNFYQIEQSSTGIVHNIKIAKSWL